MTPMRGILDEGAIVDRLHEAQRSAIPVAQLDEEITLEESYSIQRGILSRRLGRGEHLTGLKLGFTSEAKMAQMGVSDIIVGFLTNEMLVPADGSLDGSRLIHPRIEPEIAFRLSRAIEPGISARELVASVDAVAPALEVIDSRYRDFRFSLTDVISDNTSAAAYALGEWSDRIDTIADLRVELKRGDSVVEAGSTASILGHPFHALERLAALLPMVGIGLPAGATILAGSATAAIPLPERAPITASVIDLGEVSVTMSRGGE